MRFSMLLLVVLLVGCGATETAENADAGRRPPPTYPGGGLCGDPRLQGTTSVSYERPIAQCGIATPVKVTSVAGIELSTPAALDCPTAKTFADWLTDEADPAAQKILGGRIEKVWIMASYACRPRNHRKGARLSEHSFGRAIDIGGMWLSNGKEISVLSDWRNGDSGKYLREIWRAACGPFKTVLGPDGDRYHQNHFHFDRAKRSSTYCR